MTDEDRPNTLPKRKVDAALDRISSEMGNTGADLAAQLHELTDKLNLDAKGLAVVRVDVFGRGPDADVRLTLSDGTQMKGKFRDFAKPDSLNTWLLTSPGVNGDFKKPDAVAVTTLVYRCATHHRAYDEDDEAREWGREELRHAHKREVDMADQDARWAAYEELKGHNPAGYNSSSRGGEENLQSGVTLAERTVVLVDDATGERWVRTLWHQQFVQRIHGRVHDLGKRMERVGWVRSGGKGRVKFTDPNSGREAPMAFYKVPPGWEDVAE